MAVPWSPSDVHRYVLLSGNAVMVKVSTLHRFDLDMGNMVDTEIPGRAISDDK